MEQDNGNEEAPKIQKIIISNEMRLLLQVLSALAVIGNVWIVTKLSPLTKDIALISERVKALEETTMRNLPYVERFLQMEERDKAMQEDITEIKLDIREIKDALRR